jgi:hypothetical protein
VTRNVYQWKEKIESPAILKKDGYYFMFGSHLTGWNANDNVYSYARSLSGPWSSWATFADVGANTYNSQTSFILPFGQGAIYLGDRWVPSNLMRSTYIWLPLEVSGTSVRLTNRVNWVPNAAAETWSAGPSETQVEGESGALGNGASRVSCSGCSGGASAGYIGGPSSGSVSFTGISSQASGRTTLRFKVGDVPASLLGLYRLPANTLLFAAHERGQRAAVRDNYCKRREPRGRLSAVR